MEDECADFDDMFLRDKSICSDPEFGSNSFPVWGICAPEEISAFRNHRIVP
jgi:hypothetical protein